MPTSHSEERRDEMRGAIPCPVPVRDNRQLHVLVVDMLRLDKEEIFVGERPLVGRFGQYKRYVICEILLTPSFVGCVCREHFDCIF